MDEGFSIIVPVYNTPKLQLGRMLNSLIHQTDQHFTMLIVNDGSDKECTEYLRDINAKYSNIILYEKEHSGVSDARNLALKNVKTEYVAFSDADDEYSLNFVEEAKQYIEQYNPDIIYGCVKREAQEIEIQSGDGPQLYASEQNLLEVKKCLLNITPRKLPFAVWGTPCARLYRSSIAKATGFHDEIDFYEDQIFNRECLKQAESVLVVPNVWYLYYSNQFSAMHSRRREDFYGNTRTYWDAFYELNQQEPEIFRKCLRLQQFRFVQMVLDNDYVRRGKKPVHSGVNEMKEAVMHPMIQDALNHLDSQDIALSIKDRLSLYLIKTNRFNILYYIKRIQFWLNLTEEY